MIFELDFLLSFMLFSNERNLNYKNGQDFGDKTSWVISETIWKKYLNASNEFFVSISRLSANAS